MWGKKLLKFHFFFSFFALTKNKKKRDYEKNKKNEC